MDDTAAYQKRGYLKEDFHLFHLRDVGWEETEYHYHDFDKIVIFLGGKASYLIEGRSYFLEPWDVLLVSHHLIHKPKIDPTQPYERIVIYLDAQFARRNSAADEDLSACFHLAEARHFALMRPTEAGRGVLQSTLDQLEQALWDEEFGGSILAKAYFLQLLVFLNRAITRDETNRDETVSRNDPKIAAALSYINENLSTALTVEDLAKRVYISRYHFMRKFRTVTGYSVHRYVTEKRLLRAAELLQAGVSAQDACIHCGFQDYSTFQRAFKKQFSVTPREYPR